MTIHNLTHEEKTLIKDRLPSRLASVRQILNNSNIIEEFSISLLFSDSNIAEEQRKIENGELINGTYYSGYSIPMISILDIDDKHVEPLTVEFGSQYPYMNIIINKKCQREAITYGVMFICNRWYYHEMLHSSIKSNIEKINRKLYNL
ncbi:hypothetical protein PBI_SCTP2_295 [Salicola phage SCTP-2]|nr:hypothetical protein PBI_SCTP2_295 [Salicola phage SCTP-2]